MTSVLPKVADTDRTHQGRPAAMTQARCWLVWLYSGDRRLPPGCLVSQASLVISVRFVTWAMFLPRIKMQRHDIKYPLVKYNQAPVLNSFFCFRLFAFKADYIAESPLPSLFNSTYCSHHPPRTVSWGLRSSRLPCVVLVFYHSLSRWTSPGNGMQPSSKAHFRINFQNNLLMTHNCEPKRDSAFSTVLVDRQTNKIITTVIIEHCQYQKKKKRMQKHCHQGTLLTNSENWKWCSKILEAWAMESNKLSSDLFQIPPSCATLHK